MRSSKGELLTYYRFKTKPQTTRPSKKGDKASKDNESSAGDTGEEKDKSNERRSEVEHADAFTRDGDYIVFEATGHPYFPPEPAPSAANGPGDSANSKGDAPADKEDGNAASKSAKSAKSADGEPQQSKVKSESMANTLSTGSKAAHPLSQEQTLQTPTSDATTSSSRAQLQCFFCSARPYPSKNTSMLDSFLELKLENEKLRLLIADMDLTGPDNEHDRNSFAAAYHPDLLKQELESDAVAGGWAAHAVNPMFGSAAVGPDGRIMSTPSGQRPMHGSRQNSLGSHPTSPLMRTNSARDEVLAGLGVSAATTRTKRRQRARPTPTVPAQTEQQTQPTTRDARRSPSRTTAITFALTAAASTRQNGARVLWVPRRCATPVVCDGPRRSSARRAILTWQRGPSWLPAAACHPAAVLAAEWA